MNGDKQDKSQCYWYRTLRNFLYAYLENPSLSFSAYLGSLGYLGASAISFFMVAFAH